MKKVAIIGAGIAGIASAIRLAHKGYAVEVLKRTNMLVENSVVLSKMATDLMQVLLCLPCHIWWKNYSS
jgi:2-polyprenyl-6-methoxyphenol hydroxylase-like FAD-dependent oxidoreductase